MQRIPRFALIPLRIAGVIAAAEPQSPPVPNPSGTPVAAPTESPPLPPPKPDAHVTRDIEGWTVQVDTRLLSGPDQDLGERALRLLANRLDDIHIDGRNTKHYALTNQKEFFAEMTEAFFGVNDFFPFNRAELQREEPELFALFARIWGTNNGTAVKPKPVAAP